MSQTLKEKAFRGKDRATPHERISSDEPCFPNRQAQIAADGELCLQLQTIGEQEAGALNSATSSASADIVSGANDVGSSAGTSSSAHATPLKWLNWRVNTTSSKADRKVARQPVHNAARKIQSVARARLESLRAGEEARFQTELQQALRESVGALYSASSAAAETAACANAPDYVQPATASFTAAASAAAATPPAATSPTGAATLAPTVTPSASSTTAAPSTGAASSTAAARSVAPTIAAIPATTTPSTAPTQIASPALVRCPRQSQQLQLLPQGTYLPPCTMGVAIGPWGQHLLHWNMVSHQPASHHKHGEPTHFNAQNEPVNAQGKPYTPPPPPGPRGCNGGSHRSWMKREKEKAKRQQKRAATGQ